MHIKATARIEKATGQAILFFHDAGVRAGMLVVSCYCSQTQHSSATREYYKRDTVPPITDAERSAVARLVREYNGQPPCDVTLQLSPRMNWSVHA